MQIAIASGKGGTGKTSIAVNLATVADEPVCLLDCDVEAPNCRLFLPTPLDGEEPVTLAVPHVDAARCDGCRTCGGFCRFGAIFSPGGGSPPLVFPELCHGCGGCVVVCPRGAITEVARPIGLVRSGRRGGLRLVDGLLGNGESMTPAVIRAVKRHAEPAGLTLIDAPPGTSCAAVEAVRDADFVVLVTEPTPFGLHDLRLAVEMVRRLGRPFGVVVNRHGIGDERVAHYCAAEAIPLLLTLPNDRRIAEVYARGGLLVDELPALRSRFRDLLARLRTAGETDEEVAVAI
ncbi:ATP-binding protein [Thiococcus pfennigii]|jgi:MinD superfamily P-loop ATPase|uniref:ATP-binding protein n=1 Tax=Thiococcus pfennigii TaxID=1057 RepID=UPI001908E0F4|nr:ATP-binding protein [Thiococcus pfennigii]MBK1700607.1 (4Fe-4S)-binding protein [Thiococcus pfennigii]MBK1732557.1 (4Fe-4S)-binding protein [Thiococcus pfennigii]